MKGFVQREFCGSFSAIFSNFIYVYKCIWMVRCISFNRYKCINAASYACLFDNIKRYTQYVRPPCSQAHYTKSLANSCGLINNSVSLGFVLHHIMQEGQTGLYSANKIKAQPHLYIHYIRILYIIYTNILGLLYSQRLIRPISGFGNK